MTTTIRAFRKKRTSEEYYLAFDFFRDIDDGSDIVSATISVLDAQGATKTSDLTTVGKQIVQGTRVNFWVVGGTAQTYTIYCTVQTTSGEKYTYAGTMEVI